MEKIKCKCGCGNERDRFDSGVRFSQSKYTQWRILI